MPKIDGKGAEVEKEKEVAEEVKIEDEVEVRLGRDCGRCSGRVRGRNEGSADSSSAMARDRYKGISRASSTAQLINRSRCILLGCSPQHADPTTAACKFITYTQRMHVCMRLLLRQLQFSENNSLLT